MTSRVEIRWATRDDLGAIARIQAAAPGASAWEPSSYLDYDCRVACVADGDRAPGAGDRVAGFIVSREVAPPQIENAEREILSLAVDPAHRGRGVGRALVEDELARGPSSDNGARFKGAWFLEVRESNVAAIRLYAAIGFTATGRRPNYYNDPAEAAIVMRFFS